MAIKRSSPCSNLFQQNARIQKSIGEPSILQLIWSLAGRTGWQESGLVPKKPVIGGRPQIL